MSSIVPGYSNRTELADQYKAEQAQKDEIASTHAAEIDNLKKSYAAEKNNLEDRFESSVQAEKAAHYDHLRNVKTQMSREERALENTRKEVVNQKQQALKRDEISADQEGRARVAQAIQKYSAAEEYERNRALKAQEILRTDHHNNAEYIISDSQKRLNALAEEKRTYLEEAKQNHAHALEEITDHYQEARSLAQKHYSAEAGSIQSRAEQDLAAKRLASASLIEKLETKNEDPFYQIKRFDSELMDMGENYLLRVKVPDYERGQFKVQIAGQELRLLGVRSSDENVELEPGRTVSTRSYQNISERYALDSPVDGRSMSFKTDGDWMEYTIPKFGPTHRDGNRKPMVMNDVAIAQELNFKNTLPTPQKLS
jgi:hypothetical protein